MKNLERLMNLKESIEIIYVVDGYNVRLDTHNGDSEVADAHGETILEALQALDAKLERYSLEQIRR